LRVDKSYCNQNRVQCFWPTGYSATNRPTDEPFPFYECVFLQVTCPCRARVNGRSGLYGSLAPRCLQKRLPVV